MLDVIIYGSIWNIMVFMLYGIDKKRAVRQEWRISEKSLLAMTIFGGGLGAICAGHYFRHKTKKWYFQLSWYLGLGILGILSYYIYQLEVALKT